LPNLVIASVVDPGSTAFLPGSGIGDKHPGSYFRDLSTGINFFGLKILKFFDADPDQRSRILSTLDPGFGMEKIRSGIREKHPRSATLVLVLKNKMKGMSKVIKS
jgi:hypothetical protein